MGLIQGYFVDRGKDFLGKQEFVHVYQGVMLTESQHREYLTNVAEDIYRWSKQMFGTMRYTYTDFGKCVTIWAHDDEAVFHFKLRYL